MKPFEDQLRSLLKREEPPEGFAARVLARVRSEGETVRDPYRPAFFGLRSLPAWVLAGGMVCALLGAGVYAGYRARQFQRGEMAKAQAIQALRIASNELNVAFQKALVNGPTGGGLTHGSPHD